MYRFVVTRRQTGRRAVLQPGTEGIHQNNATERTTGQFFDKPTQGREDFRERTIPGNHFQEPVLPGEQCLRPLKFCHALSAVFEFAQTPFRFELQRLGRFGSVLYPVGAGIHCAFSTTFR